MADFVDAHFVEAVLAAFTLFAAVLAGTTLFDRLPRKA